MDLRQIFATNLRKARQSRGISQEQLAHDAEIDRAYVSRVERAVTFVGLEIIGKLADVLEIEPADLLKRPTRSKAKSQRREPSAGR